ncbi:hypothetical protein J6590_101599 [Homalodisca vitripennis]|nr:hypothetical protein J6590_101599 [Homalodisca vitripennis]
MYIHYALDNIHNVVRRMNADPVMLCKGCKHHELSLNASKRTSRMFPNKDEKKRKKMGQSYSKPAWNPDPEGEMYTGVFTRYDASHEHYRTSY